MTGTPASNAPHPVDLHVGALIRARRKALGVSQAQLAESLGLTFQQVQKYERGSNRVTASKLYEIAVQLDTPLASFFDGLDLPQGQGLASGGGLISGGVARFLSERGSHDLVAAFNTLTPGLRRQLVSLAQAMAESAA